MHTNPLKTACQELFKSMLWISQRVVFFYCAVYFVSSPFVDYKGMMSKGQGAALSRLMPVPEDLKYIAKGQKGPNLMKIDDYVHYYEELAGLMTKRAEVFGMLGYCYFVAGDIEKSMAAYQKALMLTPNFITFNYNLGLIYMRDGNYTEGMKQSLKSNIGLPNPHFLTVYESLPMAVITIVINEKFISWKISFEFNGIDMTS